MAGQKRPKQNISDLALFGGTAAFPEPIAVGNPNIPDIDRVSSDIGEILTSGTLSNNGPFVRRFEESICSALGTKHCIATCNATVALEIVARVLDLSGEVIVPSFTFIATPHALSWQGLTPVFVDVDPNTHTIDPHRVESAITASTSAICGVHLWGNVCDVESLQTIADRHKLALYFDASHALSATRNGTRVGNFGQAEVFSFHATKFTNAFEGGAVVTNDATLAEMLREARNFGFAENGEVVRVGVNAKMSEASAAMGLRSLECIDRTITSNRNNFHRYKEKLADCRGVNLVAPLEPEASNCQYIVCEIDQSDAHISRDELLIVLEAEGVQAKRYFHPGCHVAAPYRSEHFSRKIPLPVTDQLTQTVIVLPSGVSIGASEVDRVCALISFAVESGGEIQKELVRRHSES